MTPEQWHRVKEVFESALERPPSERSAFLDQACRGDEMLRSEVKSLLSSHDEQTSFMETPAVQMAAQSLTTAQGAELLGQQLGHYQVTREIGRGGMGVVYAAQDLILGRLVALKLLPTHLTSDPERLRRFEREGRVASTLNHPNVCMIHEVNETDEGRHFIVMEYVEGETLRRHMTGGRMGLTEALDVATQVTSGLAAAHAVGVVHRDIKPENIMLRTDGYVKVLDFGLAKLAEQNAAGMTERATAEMKTDTGVVMGTSCYMSPEQARGQAVDARTDVWSMGVVLYEMVAGHTPFEGETNSDVIVSILEREPLPLGNYSTETPAELQRIVTKALSKAKDERYQTINDLLLDLKNLKQQLEAGVKLKRAKKRRILSGRQSGAVVDGRTFKVKSMIWSSALVLMIVIGAGTWLYSFRPTLKSSLSPVRVVPFTSLPGSEIFPAFSVEGNKIAFSWGGEKDDNFDIYVKQIETGTALRLTTHAAEDLWPVWSPDGTYIAFSRLSETDGGIYIIPASGGAQRKVYSTKWEDPHLASINWSPDGKYLAFPDRGSPQELYSIFLLSLETLEPRKVTSPPEPHWGEGGDRYPVFSPDGRTLAFVRESSVATEDIYVVPVTGGEPRRLTFDNTRHSRPGWTTDGAEIIFPSMRGGANLMGLWRISVSGGIPEPLAVGAEETYDLAISRQGNRLAYAKASRGNDDIWRIEVSPATGRGSSPTKLIASTRDDTNPQYSADGKRIAFVSGRSGSAEIWTCDGDGSNPVQLTKFDGPILGSPRWSPDGRQIVFDSRPEGYSQIYVINAEGGQPRRITTGNSDDTVPSWSRDGKWIYFSSNRGGEQRIWKAPAEGGEAVPVTGRARYWGGESPDGKFFYYEVDEAGVWTIWRIPVEGGQASPVVKIGHAWGNWALTEQGIYFNNPEARPNPDIQFYSFATGRTRQITAIGKKGGYPGFHVSSDARWILYSEREGVFSSDIMLMENFR